MKKVLTALTLLLSLHKAEAQVGIGTTTPNKSAQLDVVATDKGFLMPRLTQTQRSAISSPAAGLMVYQTNGTPGFYYYTGSAWKMVNPNGWLPTGNAGLDSMNSFIGTTDNRPLRFKVSNQPAGLLSAQAGSITAWGYQAGMSNTASGLHNTAIGYQSLTKNTTGFSNTGVGASALYNIITGKHNTGIGSGALINTTDGNLNTGIGYLAGPSSGLIYNATAVGANASAACNNCLVLGSVAGVNGATASVNVGIGTTAPTHPLSFGNDLGGKMSFYTPGDNTHYGIGLQSGLLQFYTDVAGADVAFGYGSSFAFNETMRIKGNGAVAVGTAQPSSSALLDLNSTDRGFLMPRMKEAQRASIVSPTAGLMVYQTDNTAGFYYYTGSSWQMLAPANNGWKLTGNAGNPASSFIGTTDGQPLNFRVFNIAAGHISPTTLGTSFGRGALNVNKADANTAFGANALALSITGNYNTAVSGQAMFNNTTGSNNTSVGFNSMYRNTTGNHNTATGLNALHQNTIGVDNTAIGSGTLFENVSGSQNTAIGFRATTIYSNQVNATAIGANAMAGCSNCVVLGSSEGVGTGVSDVNVGIGTPYPSQALSFKNKLGGKVSFYTAGNNTHYGIGVQSGLFQFYSDYAGADIAFGYGSSDAFYENMRIKGNGNVGIGTNNPTYKLHVNGSVAGVGAYSNVSDARFKKDVTQLQNALDKVVHMRGVAYNWRSAEFPAMNFDKQQQIGFIAQELESILPEAVRKDSVTGYYSVAYSTVIPVLTEAIKEQQQIIDAQKKELDSLKSEMAEWKEKQKTLYARMNQIEAMLKQQATAQSK